MLVGFAILLYRSHMQATFMGKGADTHIGLTFIRLNIRQFVHKSGKMRQLFELTRAHASVAKFELQVGND